MDDSVDIKKANLSQVQIKADEDWKFTRLSKLKDGDVFREMPGATEYIALEDARFDDGQWAIRSREYCLRFSYQMRMERSPNGSWSARMTVGGTPYLGEGDTEREAIAELALAMGLMDEIKVLEKMAPDHNLHG